MSASNKRGPEGEPEEARDEKRQANESVESPMQAAEANQKPFVRCIQVYKTEFGSDPVLTEDPYYIILDNLTRFKENFEKLAKSKYRFFPGAAPTLEVSMNDEEEEENDDEEEQ